MTPHPVDRLSELLDDEELAPSERDAIEAHVRDCASCATVLEELAAGRARAAGLHDRPPARELWPGVASRLDTAPLAGAWLRRTRYSFTLPQLAAAAVLIACVSSAAAWLAVRGGRSTQAPAAVESALATGSAVPVANFADAEYDAAVADLQGALEAGRETLDPSTVRILQQNLAAIDRAIDQARRALESDPANTYLNTYLAEARRRKLSFLRRATALVEEAQPRS
jgi:hypothetical protein